MSECYKGIAIIVIDWSRGHSEARHVVQPYVDRHHLHSRDVCCSGEELVVSGTNILIFKISGCWYYVAVAIDFYSTNNVFYV